MNLPQKLNRKTVRLAFVKISPETWKYLFDHEKENGLSECRTTGWGVKHAWYSTEPLKLWLVERGYYMPSDFESKPLAAQTPWSILGLQRATA